MQQATNEHAKIGQKLAYEDRITLKPVEVEVVAVGEIVQPYGFYEVEVKHTDGKTFSIKKTATRKYLVSELYVM